MTQIGSLFGLKTANLAAAASGMTLKAAFFEIIIPMIKLAFNC